MSTKTLRAFGLAIFLAPVALTTSIIGCSADELGAGDPPVFTEQLAQLPLEHAPVDAERGNIPTLAPIIEAVAPSVVNIATQGSVAASINPLLQDPVFRRFFDIPDQDLPRERRTRSVGSGVIVDAADGYVLTNHHVVDNADKIVVTLRDRREFEAELIGSDPATDIAVLRINADGLDAIPLGNSDQLAIGDFVIAIGNPFGLGQTVTSGIVSAVNRTRVGIGPFEDFIQTDASINPGNSGGALVDLNGNLIGINTAIVGPGGGNVGIGFAIPSNQARDIMAQIIANGSVQRGILGVRIQDITPAIADALDLDEARGAIVAEVVPGSAAEKAGLRSGDIILNVDDEPIRDGADLRNIVGLTPVGTDITLAILRRGAPMTLVATIDTAPKDPPRRS